MKTLSDKIYIMKGRRLKDFYIEDVKQFIKDLKNAMFEDEDPCISIDKLAGDKLI